jgi:hypothetical protein
MMALENTIEIAFDLATACDSEKLLWLVKGVQPSAAHFLTTGHLDEQGVKYASLAWFASLARGLAGECLEIIKGWPKESQWQIMPFIIAAERMHLGKKRVPHDEIEERVADIITGSVNEIKRRLEETHATA